MGLLKMSIFCLKIDGGERGMGKDEKGMEEEGLEMDCLKRVETGLEIERKREAILGVQGLLRNLDL